MTTTKSAPTSVVVVDGSNIATEGRSMPSLTQLNDAVNAFRAEYPDAIVTVVVDATFGHRIDTSEVAEFDAAVAHNELVAPPAGANGRGDAIERPHHVRADLTREQRQHVGTGHLVAERLRLGREREVELLVAELRPLQPRPRVQVRLGRVDAADEVLRQSVGVLVVVERLEGARQDHTPEVPQHRVDHER